MDMSGERRLPAPRQTVWDALNNPAILKAAIPGCQSLDAASPTEMTAAAAVRIGPISAKFNGKVHLSDIDAPNGYTISGEGQGGVAGFAKGGAKVNLRDAEDGGTVLSYEVQAQVGGKIAQLGARLIDSTAKQMADAFFDNFAKELAQTMAPTPHEPATAAPSRAPSPPPPSVNWLAMVPREPMGLPLALWIGGLIWLFILYLIVVPLL
ncbi:MAG: carbon monoxide dehydrogenase subunit G [Rhodospirillales bacterium]|jgi:carbon monoxide dehydrogenase subunit G|nr:carbon monoxide dehydrogenase subunit G [Rhodospirillales bacterium]